jgi:hypothetical protein
MPTPAAGLVAEVRARPDARSASPVGPTIAGRRPQGRGRRRHQGQGLPGPAPHRPPERRSRAGIRQLGPSDGSGRDRAMRSLHWCRSPTRWRPRAPARQAVGHRRPVARPAPDEVGPVGFLVGSRQGRIGWATVAAVLEATGPATRSRSSTSTPPSPGWRHQRAGVARPIRHPRAVRPGCPASRSCAGCWWASCARAALEGVMADAIAEAATCRHRGPAGDDAERRHPPHGRVALTEGRPGLDAIGLTMFQPCSRCWPRRRGGRRRAGRRLARR